MPQDILIHDAVSAESASSTGLKTPEFACGQTPEDAVPCRCVASLACKGAVKISDRGAA